MGSLPTVPPPAEEAVVPASLAPIRWMGPRPASLILGSGMLALSLLTVRLFFAANFPSSVYTGSVCDLGGFVNCDGPAFAPLAQVAGVPLGYFGAMVGGLVVLGALFPSERLRRTNAFLAVLNGLGAAGLAVYSVFFLRSVCLYCAGYWVLALASLALFWGWRPGPGGPGGRRRRLAPSPLVLAVFGVVAGSGAVGVARLTAAERVAQTGGEAARAVREYFALPRVAWPSIVSPFWLTRSTERFEDASIQVVEYGDLLCSDCALWYRQLRVLEREFAGRINVAFQPFPLEARCNRVVPKDKHPGACDLTQVALAVGPARFRQVHDEVYGHFRRAKSDPSWRAELAGRFGVPEALADTAVRDLMVRLADTGREYGPTSERYPFGVRSTPTLIVNNRMIIGTLPTAHWRAIFQALVEAPASPAGRRYLENWVP